MDKSLGSQCFAVKKPHLLPLFGALRTDDVESYELLERMATTKCVCSSADAPDIYCGCSPDIERTLIAVLGRAADAATAARV